MSHNFQTVTVSLLLMTLMGCETANTMLSRYAPMLPMATPTALLPDDDVIITQLTGQSADYVKNLLGLPNRRDEAYQNLMVWTYIDKEQGIKAIQCEISISIRNNVVEHVAINAARTTMASLMAKPCNDLRQKIQGSTEG